MGMVKAEMKKKYSEGGESVMGIMKGEMKKKRYSDRGESIMEIAKRETKNSCS